MQNLLALWKKHSYTILLLFIILGLLDFRIGLAAILCMVGPIVFSIFKGRYWCGNICPRGSFFDNILIKFSGKRKAPKLLKSKLFRIAVTALMLTMFTLGVIRHLGDLNTIGLILYRLIVVTTIVGILLSLVYNHRTWCNFCPMGSIASFISFFRNKIISQSLLHIDTNCVSCKICEKSCPMGVVPYSYKGDSLSNEDCIQCSRCVYACPKDLIGYKKDFTNTNTSKSMEN